MQQIIISMSVLDLTSLLFLCLFLQRATSLPSFSLGLDSADSQYSIFSQSQYHFVDKGSFFKQSIGVWLYQQQNSYLTSLSSNYKITVTSNDPNYNLIVFPTGATNSSYDPYAAFSCYARAANEASSFMMQRCNFGTNYTAEDGICQTQIDLAAKSAFTTVTAFLNCSDLVVSYSMDADNSPPNNASTLFALDNTGLVAGGASSTGRITIILGVDIVGQVDMEESAKLYLLCGLTGVLILIGTGFAIVLNCKICRIDRLIEQLRSKED